MRFIPVAINSSSGNRNEYAIITAPMLINNLTKGLGKNEMTASLYDSEQVSVQLTGSSTDDYQTIAATINRISSSAHLATDAVNYDGWGFHDDAGLVSPPFFASINYPATGSDVRLVDFIREGVGTDTAIATYTQPNYKQVTEGLGNGTFSVERMIDNTQPVTITGTDSQIRNITSGSSDLFEIQSGSYSNELWEMNFIAIAGAGRTGGGNPYVSGSYGWFINAEGDIENYNIPSGSSITIQTQSGRSSAGGGLFQGREQDEIFIRKVGTSNNLSRYRIPLERKYLVQTIIGESYFISGAPRLRYMTIDGGFDDFAIAPGAGYHFVSASLPPIQSNGGAVANMWDVTGDVYLTSGSTSGSACLETTQIRYFKSGSQPDARADHQGYTASLEVGVTLYQDLGFQNPVNSTYFCDGFTWYFTDAQGKVTQVDEAFTTWDIASGSFLDLANNKLINQNGNELNVVTADHYVSQSFSGEPTLGITTAENSGSAELRFQPKTTPFTDVYALVAFYSNGADIWSIAPTEQLRILGDFDVDPGNTNYGITTERNNPTIFGGAGSVSLASGSWNEIGWNIFQYSYDNATSKIHYMINRISGSFGAAAPNLEVIRFNENQSGGSPDSKLASGSQFQVLNVQLQSKTTGSMGAEFDLYNRYGL